MTHATDAKPKVAPLPTPSAGAERGTAGARRRMRVFRGLGLASVIGCTGFALLEGCKEPSTGDTPVTTAPEAGPEEVPPARAEERPAAQEPQEPEEAIETAEADAKWEGPWLGALFMQTPVMNDMEWPIPEGSRIRDPAREKAMRIGYIRKGAKVPVLPGVRKKSNCTDGWYELVSGGFVCGRYATTDLRHPTLRLQAPDPPNMDAALPYRYGYNLTHGMPLYRAIPSREERMQYEPWLSARARPRRGIEEENPYKVSASDLDAGASRNSILATATTAAATGTPNDPLAIGLEPPAAPATPWYLREHDGGKPQITLDELQGDVGGPVVRRMVRGFYVAIDKEVEHENKKYWKSTGGHIVPQDRLMVQRTLTEFHGVWLNKEPTPALPTIAGNPPRSEAAAKASDTGFAAGAMVVPLPTKLPIGFILWNGHKWAVDPEAKKATRGEPIPRWTAVGLTGTKVSVGGHLYHETEHGFWMRNADGQITKPGAPPKDLAPGEKWVDVNLKTQTLVAFEGTTPVYATLVSTGKKDRQVKERNHETKPGVFRIREKHIAATMDGDVASDGPYSIEDVPWIAYFNGSIALHGAFWHSNFGRERSHGCVNLAPLDARAMFAWTDPPMPEGWHGVWSTDARPGSRVVVHE